MMFEDIEICVINIIIIIIWHLFEVCLIFNHLQLKIQSLLL